MNIEIVEDEACPDCGAFWGSSTLDFPNRPKVALSDGIWWWKCYNPACTVAYYEPATGAVERY